MTTVLLDAVFKHFFKIVHDTGQQLTIDRTNFLTDGFLQIIQRTVFVSVNKRFQISPKGKNYTLKDRDSEGGHTTTFNRRVVHKHAVLNRPSPHCYWSGQHRGKEWRPPAGAYLQSTTHSKDVRFPRVTLYIHATARLTCHALPSYIRPHFMLQSVHSGYRISVTQMGLHSAMK